MRTAPAGAAAKWLHFLYVCAFTLIANSYLLLRACPAVLIVLLPAFLLINLFAGTRRHKTARLRLKICAHGATLLSIFQWSTLLSVLYHIGLAIATIPGDWTTFVWSALLCILLETILFWNGILCVYCTSVQLGIKHRVIGILCGMIPVANLIALHSIVRIARREAAFEAEKEQLDAARAGERRCATKYPLVLVHGVFFRDSKYLNYWGRIPAALAKNGATIYYGNHQSAASVADSAAELAARIKEIVRQTGCEKVNLIAHSKGGLDCRYAIAHLDAAPYVASLTTINTPHRGCEFADYLLTKIPASVQNRVASMYNAALRKFGDQNPDFLAAVRDLTASVCTKLDREMPMPDGLFCRSVGSTMAKASGGKFPLNYSYHLVNHFDGANDGLVSEKSFAWGEKYLRLSVNGRRGISHGDMIDLNRENIDGFDVREFYVTLVQDLKIRGL